MRQRKPVGQLLPPPGVMVMHPRTDFATAKPYGGTIGGPIKATQPNWSPDAAAAQAVQYDRNRTK